MRVARRRVTFRVAVLWSFLAAAGSCARRAPPPVPSADPPEWSAAEQSFEQRDYASAARAYEAFLKTHVPSSNAEKALFRLALIHTLPESPLNDVEEATRLLTKFLETYPDGTYAPEARLILRLHGRSRELETETSEKDERIRQLSDELSKIKAIDLRKRPPQGG